MPKPRSRTMRAVTLSLLVCSVALLLRSLLGPWLTGVHFAGIFFAAIAVVACYGSWQASVLTATIFFLGAIYPSMTPAATDGTVGAWIDVGFYALVTVVILVSGEHVRRASRRVDIQAQAVHEREARMASYLALFAHELRNPLSALHLALLQQRTAAERNLSAPASVARVMQRQVDHMTRLVSDVLDIARIEQGKIDLRIETLTLSAVLEQVVASSASFLEPRQQTVNVMVAPEADPLNADPDRLAQMLDNLLHNASKFSPNGSTISISSRCTENGVVVSVQDSGIGIANSELERIFGSFVQVRNGAQNGLGIGLSLVRMLMRLHGGNVDARSDGLGRGATFALTFPPATQVERASNGKFERSPETAISRDVCRSADPGSRCEQQLNRPVSLTMLEKALRKQTTWA